MLIDIHEHLINCSVSLMHALSDAYGSDKGMEIWDQMADILPDDLKHTIFMNMLLGMKGEVDITSFGANPVFAAKILHQYTDLTHPEIFDVISQHRENGQPIRIQLKDGITRKSFLSEFNKLGCSAS